MSAERDIIIERLEQKLAAKDREFEQMQESLRETIFAEIEKRFADKINLRESTLDDIRMKFADKVNEILEMNKSLRDSVLEQRTARSDAIIETEERMNRLERRLVEINSAYEGVMKELLDQKSIIQEIKPRKTGREEPAARPEIRSKEETVSATNRLLEKFKTEAKPVEAVKEKPKPKGEYIIAENYVPKDKRKQQVVIEAEEKMIVSDDNAEKNENFKKPVVKRSERVSEGVEIYETPKRGR
ncbi:MAG: hypothetical protein KKI06_02385 [Euryarchaeota archaeon]|nr:hypothetical protein [Euryarchaeota archaeon]